MADLNIAQPITLKCGLTLRNRLVKSALAEHFADEYYLPASKRCLSAYSEWAKGGWGMVITGNVQVDPAYLGAVGDIAIDYAAGEERVHKAWKAWATACSADGTKTIVQINHPGRQSPVGAGTKGMSTKNLSSSPVPLHFGDGMLTRLFSSVLFGTPREMTIADIDDVVSRFAKTARLAADSGFAGVEIHAAHGYLLTQFLSSRVNQRTDAYGGSPTARAKIVIDIIHAIRAVVPQDFCVGIKLNSVDHQSSVELEECIEQIKAIAAAGVDFVEVSGGTYEDPKMVLGNGQEKSARTKQREAFFLEFAKTIRRDLPDVPLMVTGGFRSRTGMESAVAEGSCDLIGLGRPSILNPMLPREVILNEKVETSIATAYTKTVTTPWYYNQLGLRAVGAGHESAWYSSQIQIMGSS